MSGQSPYSVPQNWLGLPPYYLDDYVSSRSVYIGKLNMIKGYASFIQEELFVIRVLSLESIQPKKVPSVHVGGTSKVRGKKRNAFIRRDQVE